MYVLTEWNDCACYQQAMPYKFHSQTFNSYEKTDFCMLNHLYYYYLWLNMKYPTSVEGFALFWHLNASHWTKLTQISHCLPIAYTSLIWSKKNKNKFGYRKQQHNLKQKHKKYPAAVSFGFIRIIFVLFQNAFFLL